MKRRWPMARDARELAATLEAATAPQFRGRLLGRGQAQSMIRRDGVLPEEAPQFSAYLDDDLLSYSYALISTGLHLLEAPDGEEPLERQQPAQRAFMQASYALEAATRNATSTEELAFHRLIAGAASHLGGHAARAFSLMQESIQSGRLTPMEATLADLVLRDLDSIEDRTRGLRMSDDVADDALLEDLQARNARSDGSPVEGDLSERDGVGPVVLLLSEQYLSAVSAALFAIAYNQRSQLQAALADLEVGEAASHEVGAPGPWWVYRLTRRLLGDLGETSIRANIPTSRPPVATVVADTPGARDRDWGYLRRTFVASLFARGRSEIDLWPSQLHVVKRIFDDPQDLVVALPTSAGKTRIAELCILACLAQGRRTMYVTPLRALSAQTEQILDRTFAPLGARISSLYGSVGVTDVDENALRSSEIVVATPEKLDFALRSDPSVLDDVDLIVLDEGHMIGPSEREVRYEAQIQRLLCRADSHSRRIVCLSAVFPSGHELDDFVAWITDDQAGGLHREDWRPTQQRFGLVEWRGDHARLTMTIGDEHPFIPRYFDAKAPGDRRRRKVFPSSQRELVIATTWRLVEEGQAVLIFCPQRKSVEPYAREIIRLHRQGFIDSVVPSDTDLADALTVGAEWFGADHPILDCLKLGVVIHHGALPGPFRREVERLLHRGVIKVTVASPTLAQGLNLSASVVLFHGLRRDKTLLTGSEFANVIGRAGRAFVDTEGLVLYPLYRPTERRRREWLQLTSGEAGRTLRSGLITVGIALLRRMLARAGSNHLPTFIDYLTGGPDWAFPVIAGEDGELTRQAELAWHSNLTLLDIGILGIIGDHESDPDDVTQLVADMLRGSLWERQLSRLPRQDAAQAVRELVSSRTTHLWNVSTASQRRGWYLAGLGAASGTELGAVAADVVRLVAQTETAIVDGDTTGATALVSDVATILFDVSQFAPETSLPDWRTVLGHWLNGRPLGELDADAVSVAQFVEADLTYRLAWGMEAARVYEAAQGNDIAGALAGTALAAIETGTFSQQASILIRCGFDHRAAAIAAVDRTAATFDSAVGMREWIHNLDRDLTDLPDWPTTESHAAWHEFTNRTTRSSARRWERHVETISEVTWYGAIPEPSAWLRVTNAERGRIRLWSTSFDLLGEAAIDINPNRRGVLHARRIRETRGVELRYLGPTDLLASDA
jgi:superfamily II DNA/RNA helicase